MCHRRDTVIEALHLDAGANDAGLEAFDVIDAAEDLVLKSNLVARIERRVADDNDIAIYQFLRRTHRQSKHPFGWQPVYSQQCNVPVRVDHLDAADGEVGGAVVFRGIDLSLVVYGRVAGLVPNRQAESAGKDLRDMAVGRDQSVANYEAGS